MMVSKKKLQNWISNESARYTFALHSIGMLLNVGIRTSFKFRWSISYKRILQNLK